MRFQLLALRLAAVEAKVATLTGSTADVVLTKDTYDFEIRLFDLETKVDELVAAKTKEQVNLIVTSEEAAAPVAVADVVALSASAGDENAESVVANVVQAQFESAAVADADVAAVIAAAVSAVVNADADVVADKEAIKEEILNAVAEATPPADLEAATEAVAKIIAAAQGEEVSSEQKEEVSAAVAEVVVSAEDRELDELEKRLEVVETKVETLLGK